MRPEALSTPALSEALSMSGAVRGRLAKGIIANVMGKAWVVLAQLVTIPVLTHAWGATGYGTWLMVSTIPTYLALGDFGFGGVAAVEMTRHASAGNRQRALSIFQSSWILVTTILGCLIIGTLLLFSARASYLSLLPAAIQDDQVFATGLVLSFYAFFVIQMTVINSAFRATGRYSQGTFLNDIVMPAETAVIAAVSLSGGKMIDAAVGILVMRVVSCAAFYWILRSHEPWIAIGVRHASTRELKALIKPSIASLALTASSALSLQGMVVVVGMLFSPAAAAVFNAARALTRVPVQAVGVLARASGPELTRAYALGEHKLFIRIISANVATATAISVSSAFILAFAGGHLVAALSRGALRADWPLMSALSSAMVAHSIWSSIAQGFTSINRQHVYSHYYVWLTLLPFGLIIVLHTRMTLVWIGCATALAELIMLVIICLRWHGEAARLVK